MRVVLDSNAIVSGLNFPGNERRVLELALRGRFDLYISAFVLDEVRGVLVRKFTWSPDQASQALRMLRAAATIIEPRRFLSVVEGNQADNRILECAVEAAADYLITGDKRHLLPLVEHTGTRIVNAPRFLFELEG